MFRIMPSKVEKYKLYITTEYVVLFFLTESWQVRIARTLKFGYMNRVAKATNILIRAIVV